jgi:protein-tyrosine phosphatase
MTKAHRDFVLELAPRQLDRTFTLSEAARLASESSARKVADLGALRPSVSVDELWDVPDPIGQTKDVYEMVAEKIAALLYPVLDLWQREEDSGGREPAGGAGEPR